MYFLNDEFWLAISFLLFLYFVYKPIKKAILTSLDAKILIIKEQVLEAKKLNEDATLLFQETEKQLKQVSTIQDQMLENSQKETDKLIAEKNQELERFLERKKLETINLIDNQELQACKTLQHELNNRVIRLVKVYLKSLPNNYLSDSEIAEKFIKHQSHDYNT